MNYKLYISNLTAPDKTFYFFQNEEIFVQLDELDELDRIIDAWKGFNNNLTQAQKTF